MNYSRRRATIELTVFSSVATRRELLAGIFPALKRRATLTPTLRVENLT